MEFSFEEVLTGLRNGDFSRMSPAFDESSGESAIMKWHQEGSFGNHPAELDEAVSCAAFLGRPVTLQFLLDSGLSPEGGGMTGLNAIHWASNRGHLETFRQLLKAGAKLEVRNMYGGTVLGLTVWSAINEPRGEQLQIIRELIAAGADVSEVEKPTGRPEIDELL